MASSKLALVQNLKFTIETKVDDDSLGFLPDCNWIGSECGCNSEAELNFLIFEKITDLKQIPEEVQKSSKCPRKYDKCLSFKVAKKHTGTITLFFKVDSKFLRFLKSKRYSQSLSFLVEGHMDYVTFNTDTNIWSVVASKPLEFNGSLQPDRCGKLLLEQDTEFSTFFLKPPLCSRLAFNWSVTVEWKTEYEVPLQINPGIILSNMLSNEETKDLTIIARDGFEGKCHKVVFAAHSPIFTKLCSLREGENPGRIEISELTKEGLTHLLNYFYGKELPMSELNSNVALELFQVSQKYQLVETEERFQTMFLKKDMTWFSPDAALELYYFTKDLDKFARLEKRALEIMRRMKEAVKSCKRYEQLEKEEIVELLWLLLGFQNSTLDETIQSNEGC